MRFDKYLNLLSAEELEKIAVEKGSPDGLFIWGEWQGFVNTWKATGKSPHTVANTWNGLRLLILEGGIATYEDWDSGTKAFEAFHRLKEERKWSAVTLNTYRKNANTYFAYLVRRDVIAANPIRKVEKSRERANNYPLPSIPDVKKVFGYLNGRPCANCLERRRNVLFFLLLRDTGVRPQEMLATTLASVENRKEILIHGAKIGGKPRNYPLSGETKEALRGYVLEVNAAGRADELEKALFLSVKGGGWTYAGVRKLLERVNREAGIETRITCYSFRRGAATALFKRKVPLEQISKYLGHSRTATTMRYVQNLSEINEEAVGIISGMYSEFRDDGELVQRVPLYGRGHHPWGAGEVNGSGGDLRMPHHAGERVKVATALEHQRGESVAERMCAEF